MKRKILLMLCCLSICFGAVACGSNDSNAYDKAVEVKTSETFGGGYFIVESEWEDSSYYYKIVYARDTGVKYFVINSGYKLSMTPLYNTDGSLQVADGYETEE